MYEVQSSPTLLSALGKEREYLLQEEKRQWRDDIELEEKSRMCSFQMCKEMPLQEFGALGLAEVNIRIYI